MDLVTLLLLAVGLSADAFAVSICKGLAMSKITWKECLIVGTWFGGFQGIMPFIGYVLGVQFEKYINEIAPWVAFALLALIGGDMIKEALSDEPEEETATLKVQEMLLLAIATSIDALAVGITFACVPVTMLAGASTMINTVVACGIIACTTLVISMAGVNIGHVFGTKYKNKAEFVGGLILVLLGVKIILEHFNVF